MKAPSQEDSKSLEDPDIDNEYKSKNTQDKLETSIFMDFKRANIERMLNLNNLIEEYKTKYETPIPEVLTEPNENTFLNLTFKQLFSWYNNFLSGFVKDHYDAFNLSKVKYFRPDFFINPIRDNKLNLAIPIIVNLPSVKNGEELDAAYRMLAKLNELSEYSESTHLGVEEAYNFIRNLFSYNKLSLKVLNTFKKLNLSNEEIENSNFSDMKPDDDPEEIK